MTTKTKIIGNDFATYEYIKCLNDLTSCKKTYYNITETLVTSSTETSTEKFAITKTTKSTTLTYSDLCN